MGGEDGVIELDWRIRVWVLVPITLATVCMGLLRHYAAVLMFRRPTVDLLKVRDACAIERANRLTAARFYMHRSQFEARRAYLSAPDGPLRKEGLTSSSPMSLLMNPEHLSNQVGGLVSGIVPQMLVGAWVRAAFSGFAVCRLPFPLGQKFRGMMQAGIERVGQNFEVGYVSALSWYVINIFGNQAVVRLLTDMDGNRRGGQGGPGVGVEDLAANLSSGFQSFNGAREAAGTRLCGAEHRGLLGELEENVISMNPADLGAGA